MKTTAIYSVYVKRLHKAIWPPYQPTFNLTRREAKQVRFYRCKKDYSWRAVARVMSEKYPWLNISSGNQIDGLHLCNDAMRLLKEDVSPHKWN